MHTPIRIIQKEIEAKYSRTNIRAKVLADIVGSTSMEPKIAKAVGELAQYLNKSYYDAKDNRILEYRLNDKAIDLEAVVLEILIAVMPCATAQTIQGVVGRLAPLLDYEDLYDGVTTAAEMIAVCCFSDLYDIIPASNSETGSLMIKSNYALEEETMQFIANTKYMPPMICSPNTIKCNTDRAYLTIEGSIILGKHNHHNFKQAWDVLNILNQTKLSIDQDIMVMNEPLKLKPHDDGTQLTLAEVHERTINHQRMVHSSQQVYKLMIGYGNEFYMEWLPDKRGRMYSQGYHLNVQGSEYKKAMLNLSKLEVITC